ncbi:protoporphyrinogen/coproporphyrinogen oxidase [Helicobacter saguini]|uniref:protoporphyrinogen/coproporphyrinogen oxidase n=2 Tax=Helicobacter saguini TaxID=1548018 RepID=UPI001F1910D4|nr:NAD(P)-binding protein [Helicobacter saguini]
MKVVILGAGIAGLSAGYHLKQKGIESVIYEKDSTWGGLCGNFVVDNFLFDKAVHLSFAKDKYVQDFFADSTELIKHIPVAYNYYESKWLRHPAQNNLAPLDSDEKVEIINDFIENKNTKRRVNDYADWLIAQFGEVFATKFPFKYTRKYWCKEAQEMGVKWLESAAGSRFYKPNMKEVLKGAFETQDFNFYYAKEMRYPKSGGYKSFFKKAQKECNIAYNKEVVGIDSKEKILYFKDGTNDNYDKLISSLPLPLYADLLSLRNVTGGGGGNTLAA